MVSIMLHLMTKETPEKGMTVIQTVSFSDYASESCGHVFGPDQLTVLEFDRDVDYNKNKPSTEQELLPPAPLR